MKRVILEIEKGMISPISIPMGIEIVIRDLDIEGCDEDELKDNQKYIENIYTIEDVT